MHPTAKILFRFLCFFSALAVTASAVAVPQPVAMFQETSAPSVAKRLIGAIKAINGNTITLTPDSGAQVSVTVDTSTHMRRIAPGEKDLKNATAVQLTDLQVGDRILVGGKASDDGKSLAASSIIVMKRSDVEAKQEQERQDWQKRGLGGLVGAVDPSSGTITISVTGFGGTKSLAVHTSKSTIFRRYAPDSVKFDDAKPSSLQQIKPGDQLRARGDRSADGSELTADEIVTGSFRNVAGVVNSADASTGMISIQDLLTKKPVQIKVSSDSQLHKLPPEMAQRIAMRLKGAAMGGRPGGAAAGGGNSSGAAAGGQSAPNVNSAAGASAVGGATGGMGGGMRQGGAPDFNQMLSRMPVISMADLHKGDALLIVATEGSDTSASTAITLVSGVEPILQAAPSAGQAMMLAPWSLGGPSGDAGNQ